MLRIPARREQRIALKLLIERFPARRTHVRALRTWMAPALAGVCSSTGAKRTRAATNMDFLLHKRSVEYPAYQPTNFVSQIVEVRHQIRREPVVVEHDFGRGKDGGRPVWPFRSPMAQVVSFPRSPSFRAREPQF